MTRLKNLLLFILCVLLTISLPASMPVDGKINQPSKVLIIFDVSKSMMAVYENSTRMEAAKQLAYSIIDSLSTRENLQMALRAYGAEKQYPPGDCKDSKLIFGFENKNAEKIKAYIGNLKPTGITPIAYSLEQAANDFAGSKTKNFIIIITDGLEECGGNICQAAINLSEKGIVLRPFIVGIGLSEEQSREFECVGNYFNAGKDVTFSNLSNVIITQILNPTSAQVNLMNKQGQPTETNVGMIFYDIKDQLPEYKFIHTFNRSGNPDTLYLDVYRKYSILVSTIPEVRIDTAEQALGKHNIFAVDASQGELRLIASSPLLGSDPLCIVRKHGETRTLNFQKFNTSLRYLCGDYDLEIMTRPKIKIEGVNIPPEGKSIKIPAAGQFQIQTRKKIFGSVYLEEGKEMIHVLNLSPEGTNTFSTFLQPGKYVLIYRDVDENRILNSQKYNFSIGERNVTIVRL